MRIATFNVESLFDRPVIMNLPSWDEGKKVLADFTTLTNLTQKETYSQSDKSKMLEITKRYPGLIANSECKYIILRVNHGSFLKKGKTPTIVANGRADWIGNFELKAEHIEEPAIENTARVIKELAADVMCVVEAEDRISLKNFNEIMLPKVGGQAYEHVMLIDGNDARGIDVGIMVRGPLEIERIASHVDDKDETGRIFSRDCAEYVVKSGENKVLVMVNHLKSKGYGSPAASSAKRVRQAERVKEIYEDRLREYPYIAIVGDFNDTPASAALKVLEDAGLVDIMDVQNEDVKDKFHPDGRPGTWGTGAKSGKFDYILMSPKLVKKLLAGGVERRGVWGGKDGTIFPHFPEITKPEQAASDHAALWAEFDI